LAVYWTRGITERPHIFKKKFSYFKRTKDVESVILPRVETVKRVVVIIGIILITVKVSKELMELKNAT